MPLLPRLDTHLLLSPKDVPPTRDDMKVVGVFNPGAITVQTPEGPEIVLLLRVVEQPIDQKAGCRCSPRFEPGRGLVLDDLAEDDIDFSDPRVYHLKSSGMQRLRFISHLKVVRTRTGTSIDKDQLADAPAVMAESVYEEYGVEDPRITCIDGTYYITYVAVSRHGVGTCLASTRDFVSFERHGFIFCPENKDVLIFPEKIGPDGGQFVAMHRPMTTIRFRPPEMWLARSPDLMHWGEHTPLHSESGDWGSGRIGGGTPPIRTPRGWLTIYHGSEKTPDGKGVGMYTAGGLLLDLEDPAIVTESTDGPIMMPELPFEKTGFVDNVVFPTAVIDDPGDANRLLVYYGAADEHLAVAVYDRSVLMGAFKPLRD